MDEIIGRSRRYTRCGDRWRCELCEALVTSRSAHDETHSSQMKAVVTELMDGLSPRPTLVE